MSIWIKLLRASVASAAIVAVSLTAAPSPLAAATLQDAFVAAYLTSPRIEAGRARLRQANELVPQALSGWRPQVFLDGGIEGVDAETDIGSANRTSPQASLSVRQNLYAGGGTVAATNQAENQVQAERQRLVALEQTVLLDVVDAYTAVWRDQSVLELALNNEQRLRRQLEATRDRFSVGEVARTDVAQAEARLARARADIETAKADLAASRALYKRVVGEEPRNLKEPAALKRLPRSLADAQAIAAANPEIIAATFDLYAARDAVDVQLADLLPSLDLQAESSYADQPSSQLRWQRQNAVGLNLSIPLYQGGGEYAEVRQSRQRARELRDQLEESYRTVQQAVNASWDRLLAAEASIEAFREEVRANRIALEGVEQEALVGARTVLDVLDAEQELFTSEVNLVRAVREEILASYQVKQAVGELTVANLALPVEPYDPAVEYRAARTRLFGLSE